MLFGDNELVMYKQNGKIYSGGFEVNSVMLEHGISPITRVGGGSKTGGAMNESFNNLAIPAGLYYFDTGLVGQSGGKEAKHIAEDAMDDDMYSSLMELAGNVANEHVGGGDDADSDNDNYLEAGSEPVVSVGGKKHKKTKKHRLIKEKRRKTRRS